MGFLLAIANTVMALPMQSTIASGGNSNWSTGEPNNALVNGERQNYLHYWPTNSEWDDMENGRYMAGHILELDIAIIPEPTTMLLFGTGLLGLVGVTSPLDFIPVDMLDLQANQLEADNEKEAFF